MPPTASTTRSRAGAASPDMPGAPKPIPKFRPAIRCVLTSIRTCNGSARSSSVNHWQDFGKRGSETGRATSLGWEFTVTPDPTLQLSRDNRSGPLYRVHTDRPTVLSIGYSTHREEYLLSGGKTLATLKIFLTQARQVVSSDPLGAKHYVDRALALLSHTPASAKSPDTDTVQ